MSSGSKDFEDFARDCVRLAGQADSAELREKLLNQAGMDAGRYGRGRGVMHSRPEQYRRLGIVARQRAAEANDPAVKAAFEEVAANWYALAEQLEWIEGRLKES